MICNQIVTWTAFAILAMFYIHCLQLGGNDNFDGRNWLSVIYQCHSRCLRFFSLANWSLEESCPERSDFPMYVFPRLHYPVDTIQLHPLLPLPINTSTKDNMFHCFRKNTEFKELYFSRTTKTIYWFMVLRLLILLACCYHPHTF